MKTVRRKYRPEDTFLKDFWIEKNKTQELYVKTDVYFPDNIDKELINNLWNIENCYIDNVSCIKITIETLALKVYEVQEITEEWEFFKASPNFYVMEDGIDIHKILRGIPCFLLKENFEIASNRKTVSKTQ